MSELIREIRQPPKIDITTDFIIIMVIIAAALVGFIIYLMYRNGTIDEHAQEGATHRIHYNLTAKESENLLKNSAISFAIMLILGYIIPTPYNGFSLFATAIAFLISGAYSKQQKPNPQNKQAHPPSEGRTCIAPTCAHGYYCIAASELVDQP